MVTTRLEQFMADRAAEVYEEKRDGGHDFITSEMAPIVAKLIPVGGKVLDVGCGQGPALEWFKKNGFDAIGISTNRDEIAALERNFSVHYQDMHNLSGLWFGYFDCVWARHVLEHSPIPFFTLAEFDRILKPQGVLYAEMPAPETPCRHETNPNHYSVFGLEMWLNLIARSGFEILEVRNINLTTHVGPDLYWSLICKKL